MLLPEREIVLGHLLRGVPAGIEKSSRRSSLIARAFGLTVDWLKDVSV